MAGSLYTGLREMGKELGLRGDTGTRSGRKGGQRYEKE